MVSWNMFFICIKWLFKWIVWRNIGRRTRFKQIIDKKILQIIHVYRIKLIFKEIKITYILILFADFVTTFNDIHICVRIVTVHSVVKLSFASLSNLPSGLCAINAIITARLIKELGVNVSWFANINISSALLIVWQFLIITLHLQLFSQNLIIFPTYLNISSIYSYKCCFH